MGMEGDCGVLSFVLCKVVIMIYFFDGVDVYVDVFDVFGLYMMGVGCFYFKDFD